MTRNAWSALNTPSLSQLADPSTRRVRRRFWQYVDDGTDWRLQSSLIAAVADDAKSSQQLPSPLESRLDDRTYRVLGILHDPFLSRLPPVHNPRANWISEAMRGCTVLHEDLLPGPGLSTHDYASVGRHLLSMHSIRAPPYVRALDYILPNLYRGLYTMLAVLDEFRNHSFASIVTTNPSKASFLRDLDHYFRAARTSLPDYAAWLAIEDVLGVSWPLRFPETLLLRGDRLRSKHMAESASAVASSRPVGLFCGVGHAAEVIQWIECPTTPDLAIAYRFFPPTHPLRARVLRTVKHLGFLTD